MSQPQHESARDASWTLVQALLAVSVLCGVAVVPLLRGDSPCTHDGGLHFFRVAAMRHAVKQGIVFSRWLPDLAFGYGFPFFNYRAPLSYYLPLGFHLLGLPLSAALNLVYVLSLVTSGLGAYALGRDLFGPRAGLVAAVAYVYAPYQLLDALVRGNAPESVALALLPVILWAFRRLMLEGGRRWFAAAVVSLAALYVGHNISSLLFTPLLFGYLVLLQYAHRKRAGWGHALLALGLALGITCFFWFPALAEKEYVQLYLTGATRNNDFRHNFLTLGEILALPEAFDTSLLNPPLKIRIGFVPLTLAALGVVSGLAACRRQKPAARVGYDEDSCSSLRERRPSLIFFAGCLVLFVFMSTSMSVWLWEHVPLLPFVQFPWRFVGRASLPVALLAGAVVLPEEQGAAGNDRGCLRSTVGRLLPLALTCGVVLAALPWTYPPRGYCPMMSYPTVQDVHHYERNSGLVGVDPVGAYFPVWVQERPAGSPLEAQYDSDPVVERFDRRALPEDGQILEAEYGPNRARIEVDAPSSFQARYLSFYFPGWRVDVDGEQVEVKASDPQGLITFEVPAGRHVVVVRFGETPLRLAADAVSLLSLLVAVTYGLHIPRSGWRRGSESL